MGVAKEERAVLCDLFTGLGPDAPTLCAGWQTRDLAAHLVIRERRPDAAPGILLRPLAGYTRRVQDSYAAMPWARLVELVRTGPPRLSPMSLRTVDEVVNTVEYVVHHEDARRGQPDWRPRPPDARRDGAVWAAVSRAARMMLRRSPVGVVLRRAAGTGGDAPEVTAKRGPDTVIVSGAPIELLLFAFGRDAVRVDFDGDQAAIGIVRGLTRGL